MQGRGGYIRDVLLKNVTALNVRNDLGGQKHPDVFRFDLEGSGTARAAAASRCFACCATPCHTVPRAVPQRPMLSWTAALCTKTHLSVRLAVREAVREAVRVLAEWASGRPVPRCSSDTAPQQAVHNLPMRHLTGHPTSNPAFHPMRHLMRARPCTT